MRRLTLALVPVLVAACASTPHAAEPPPVVTVGITSPHGTASLPVAPVVSDGGTDGGTTEAADGATPNGAEGLYQEGLRAYARGDLQAAARAFSGAYEQRPSPELAFNAGRVYERMAMVSEATRYYGYVLAAAPDGPRRADIEARLAALRDYERRRSEDFAQPPPGTDALAREAGTWFTRGVTLYRRHAYDAALRAFEAAHQYTNSPELLFNLAVTHEHLGQRGDAVDAFRAYLQQRPDSPDRTAIEQRLRALEAGGR